MRQRFKRQLHVAVKVFILRTTMHVMHVKELQETDSAVLLFVFSKMPEDERQFQ